MHNRPNTLSFILKSMIPYSRENMLLAFKPSLFFNELERISDYKKSTLKSTFYRAKQAGYIVQEENLLKITQKGLNFIRPFTAKKLNKDARLMIIFDIPEAEAHLRSRLRLLLRQWHFLPVQKSVWLSEYDLGQSLTEAIDELKLKKYVQVYECARIFPKK